VLNAFRGLVLWGRGVRALRRGGIRLFDSPANTLVFLREDDADPILACFNFGAAPAGIRVPVPGRLEPLTGHGFAPAITLPDSVTVPAQAAYFARVHPQAGR
jgi:hypothetical protein